jgi:hypothetical protein
VGKAASPDYQYPLHLSRPVTGCSLVLQTVGFSIDENSMSKNTVSSEKGKDISVGEPGGKTRQQKPTKLGRSGGPVVRSHAWP